MDVAVDDNEDDCEELTLDVAEELTDVLAVELTDEDIVVV